MAGLVGFGGLPTGPDVKKLNEQFGVPEPGAVVGYDVVAAVIGAKPRSSRFVSVTNAWRKGLLKGPNTLLICEDGQRFRALSFGDRVGHARGEHARGARQIRRATVYASLIDLDQLPGSDRKFAEMLQRVTADSYKRMSEAVKALKPPKPPEQLPRG